MSKRATATVANKYLTLVGTFTLPTALPAIANQLVEVLNNRIISDSSLLRGDDSTHGFSKGFAVEHHCGVVGLRDPCGPTWA